LRSRPDPPARLGRPFRAIGEDCAPREQEVLKFVIAGRLNKQIAFKLGISEKTVKVHRGRVMEKMRAGSVVDLVHLVEEAGDAPRLETAPILD